MIKITGILLMLMLCAGCCGDYSIEVARGTVKDVSYLTPSFGQDSTIIKLEEGGVFNLPYRRQVPCKYIKIMRDEECCTYRIVCINKEETK